MNQGDPAGAVRDRERKFYESVHFQIPMLCSGFVTHILVSNLSQVSNLSFFKSPMTFRCVTQFNEPISRDGAQGAKRRTQPVAHHQLPAVMTTGWSRLFLPASPSIAIVVTGPKKLQTGGSGSRRLDYAGVFSECHPIDNRVGIALPDRAGPARLAWTTTFIVAFTIAAAANAALRGAAEGAFGLCPSLGAHLRPRRNDSECGGAIDGAIRRPRARFLSCWHSIKATSFPG